MSDTLLLLDGHSLAYRAFFALPPTIATTSGQPTNAVYGFTSMLIKLLADLKSERIAVAFDMGAPTVRIAAYADYKAQRAETPGEFRGQIDLIRDVLAALRVPVIGMPAHEADDVIASLARTAAEEGLEVICVTADRDYFQLIRPGVQVLFNRRGVSETDLYDEAAVVERFGLQPNQYIDYAALRGDPSDNLPGVPGVGEKTASQLVQLFSSVEGVYEHLDELPKRIVRLRGALEEAKEQVLLNKRLMRLVDDLDVGLDPIDVRMGEWDEAEIREVFNALQFKALLPRLLEARPLEQAAPEQVAMTVGETAAVREGAPVALIAAGDGIAIAAPGEDPQWFADAATLRDLLADPTIGKVTHGWKDLAVALGRRGLELRGVVADTRVAAYLLDPAPGQYDLADLSLRYLRRPLPEIGGGDQGQLALGFSEETTTAAAGAAGASAAALLDLADVLHAKLDETGMRALYRDLELPLGDVLKEMELTGVAIDTELLGAQSADLGKQIADLEARAYDLAGGPFNLGSPPQLRVVLYERLGLKPGRRTKTGYSTDAAALESLRGEHEIVAILLEHRELSKLRNTYIDALPRLVDPASHRVHCVYEQTAVATGRISSRDPNLQNVPIRTETGRAIRRAFIAGFPKHVLIVADYSQIELRVLAHVSKDEGLRAAFAKDEDIHAATAGKIWGFAVEDVPRDLRARAKAINFGLTYGMNRFGLAQRLGITPEEADTFINGYFDSFPGVRTFMTEVVQNAYRDGATTTLLGRRRYLPELGHGDQRVRALGERMALNAPIQGSAADIIKLAMLHVRDGLRARGLDARMVLTVHDELVLEVPETQEDDTFEAVRSLMEQAYPLDVPLRVDISVGSNWADAKE